MDGLEKLGKELELDMLLVDTPAGLNEDTLQAIAVSNAIVLVLHPDKHDFQGTAVTVDMARRLQVPAIHLVLNDAPDNLNVEDARSQLEQTYHCGGGIVLNHTEELMTLASSQPFVLRYPEHPLTVQIKELAEQIVVWMSRLSYLFLGRLFLLGGGGNFGVQGIPCALCKFAASFAAQVGLIAHPLSFAAFDQPELFAEGFQRLIQVCLAWTFRFRQFLRPLTNL